MLSRVCVYRRGYKDSQPTRVVIQLEDGTEEIPGFQ